MKIKYLIVCFLILFLVSGCVEEEVQEEDQIVEEIAEGVQVEEEPVFVSHIVVKLTSDKVMDPDNLQINEGDVIKWVNEDKRFNHNLVIYPADIERPITKDIIVKSGNIAPEGSWDYTFEEAGEYVVKDIYSGTMRGEVTAEVTAIISEGKDIGTIYVVE
jgi:plastocyanin